jgi:hypothetical protein
MFEFPKGRKKITSTIKRYERLLRKEQEETGAISDGYGKRYFLGIFYLLLGDTQGAIRSFEWFERTFEDDGSEPFHSLTWALTLYRSGRIEEASKKLRHTMLLNLYLIPHLLGMRHKNLDIWYASNWCQKSYLKDAPPEIFDLWDTEALDWARAEYDSVEFLDTRVRYIEIYRQLKNEPVGPRRFNLVAEAGRLEDGEE